MVISSLTLSSLTPRLVATEREGRNRRALARSRSLSLAHSYPVETARLVEIVATRPPPGVPAALLAFDVFTSHGSGGGFHTHHTHTHPRGASDHLLKPGAVAAGKPIHHVASRHLKVRSSRIS